MPVIKIDGEIGWDVTIEGVRAELEAANGQPVTVEISSPGGSVFEGIGIYNLIRAYKGAKETKIIGLAASMGSYIALATDRITALDNAVYMIHNAYGLAIGDHKELRKTADVMESLSGLLSKAYQKKTGKSKEEIAQMMDAETFLFGDEIAEAGFADEIIGTEKSEDKSEALAYAKLQLEDCQAKLKTEEKAEDLLKVAALLQSETTGAAQKPQAPTANENPKGAEKMPTLEELLAANPEAKAEFDAKLAAKVEPKAEEKPQEEPKAESKNKMAYNVLESDAYPKKIKDSALAVLKGEKSADSLEALVDFYDMQQEEKKSAEAQDQTQKTGETPAKTDEPTGLDEKGVAHGKKGIESLAAMHKGGK